MAAVMRVPNRFRALLMFFNSLRKKVWQSGISTRLDEDVDDFAAGAVEQQDAGPSDDD